MEDINNRIIDIVLDKNGELIYDNTAKPLKAKISCHFVYCGKIYVCINEKYGFFHYKQLEDGNIQLKEVDDYLAKELERVFRKSILDEFRNINLYSKFEASFGKNSKMMEKLEHYFVYMAEWNNGNIKDTVLKIYKDPFFGKSLETINKVRDLHCFFRWSGVGIKNYMKFIDIIKEDVENNPNEYNTESKESNQEEQAENNSADDLKSIIEDTKKRITEKEEKNRLLDEYIALKKELDGLKEYENKLDDEIRKKEEILNSRGSNYGKK